MNLFKLLTLGIGLTFFSLFFPSIASAEWTNQGDMLWTQHWHRAVSLENGKVLITGGNYTTSGTTHTQMYVDNLAGTGAWTRKKDMNRNREFFTLDIINVNGIPKVLAAGGHSDSCPGCISNTAELYNTNIDTWVWTPNMNDSRVTHASSILSNGRVLVSGGSRDGASFSPRQASTEIYDPSTNTWILMSPLNTPRTGHSQVTYKDIEDREKVMVIGGGGIDGVLNSTEIYDPSTDTWSFGPNISHPRVVFNAVLLHDGRILIVGGRTTPANKISEIYDPNTNSWTSYEMPYYSYDNQAVVLGKEAGYKVLVAGGSGNTLGKSNAALFDPETNEWIEIEEMNAPRTNFSLTLLDNERVLATGGYNSITGRLKSSEIYTTGDVLGETAPPVPFLDLPWDYGSKNMSFQEAALSINSYFDHTYPLLNSEPSEFSNQVTTFRNKVESVWYSSHNGYDYGKSGGAQVGYGENVLAAANGLAEYVNTCAPCGNMIEITHENGYQTKYMHLDNKGLISVIPGNKVPVTTGQKIGEVGLTGNTNGAHIHFGLYHDKNDDGNFLDNVLSGLTDPYGWQSEEADPWEIFSAFVNGQEVVGNKSYYLWKTPIEQPTEVLNQLPKIIQTERFKFEFAQDTIISSSATITLKPEPTFISALLNSLGSIIKALAVDESGNEIQEFNQPYTLTVDFSTIDITRYDTSTLSIYSSEDGINWTKEVTEIDLEGEKAIAILDHFSYFALMGERADTITPTTTVALNGDEGNDNWFRSDVEVVINSDDNDGGLGVQYTAVNVNNGGWEEYTSPFTITEEGNYKIEYYSEDNDGNVEEIQTLEFNIDKTKPETSINTTPAILWPPNGNMVPVTITGSANDENLYAKSIAIADEYGEINLSNIEFGDTVKLQALRRGNDNDGRTYTIIVSAQDMAGNISVSTTKVMVLHDNAN